MLDFVFARWFFCFPNRGATPRIPAPALGHPVPIEEYIFYLSGFVMILLLYVWLSEYWLVAYSVPDYVGETRTMRRLFRFHPTSLLVGLVLIALSILFKKWISPLDDGWAGYFIVLMVGGLVPSMSFFPTTCRFINWRALSLTLFLVLLISLLWEATLALPYGWWNYQHRQMMGLFIGAWDDLPIETVFVWLAVAYGTIIVFEVLKLWQASGLPAKEALLGSRERPTSHR